MEITINYYGQAVSVSVEVYEYLTQAVRLSIEAVRKKFLKIFR